MAEDDSRALFFKAVSLQGEGKVDEAEALYRELLARNPRVVSAHNNLGMLLNATGRLLAGEASAQSSHRAAF